LAAILSVVGVAVFLLAPALAVAKPKKGTVEVRIPELLLDGGRKLSFERSFSSERDVKPKRGFWNRVLDVIAGEPDFKGLVRPYSVVTDSHDRVIVSDPGAHGIHIFDFAQQKYKFISRPEGKNSLEQPQCIAVDNRDDIYATDSEAGKVFVFEPGGKLKRVIGSLKGGEGFFKRPTGIAVDSEAQRIYVSDTLRNKIYILDMQGNVLQSFGKTGSGNGEFNYPTELRLDGSDLIVVDAMNFRLQIVDRSGQFKAAIGQIGDSQGYLFRPKGIGIDSEDHFYVAEALSGMVQVFDREGHLLYYFGKRGTGFGDFQLPAGVFIDRSDRVYVVDSLNRRVQVFQYHAVASHANRGAQ
jgi:DNA-binding beta-propeller fold protein YncE